MDSGTNQVKSAESAKNRNEKRSRRKENSVGLTNQGEESGEYSYVFITPWDLGAGRGNNVEGSPRGSIET